MRAGSEARMRGRGRGRSLRWAPVVTDDRVALTIGDAVADRCNATASDRSCGSSGVDDRGRSEHHSGGVSSSGAPAREPSAGSERSAFTEAPGDSVATDEETSAVAEHAAKDAQSAVAEAESEDGRPPMRASGWRKEIRNTAPPAVAGKEKQPLKMPHSMTGKMWATSASFSGIGESEQKCGRRRTKTYRQPNQNNAQIIGLSECEKATGRSFDRRSTERCRRQ